MNLRILSWNVSERNPDCSRISAALEAIQPDVALLQELTEKHLLAVRRAFSFVSVCKATGSRKGNNFVAIASKASQRGVRKVGPNNGTTGSRSILARVLGSDECQNALCTEVAYEGSWLPIACFHASAFASPSHRENELRVLLAALPPSGPLALGGDFNSYSRPIIAWPAGLVLGYKSSDFRRNEGQRLKAMLASLGFEGGSQGRTTRFLPAALDHVFARSCSIVSSQIVGRRYGSDHNPVIADLRFGN